MKDTTLKQTKDTPTPEQIAQATDASRVLRHEHDSGRRRRNRLEDHFGGSEHSAFIDLLRQDERLTNLLASVNREAPRARPSGNSNSQSSALAQVLFGHLM